MDEITDLLVTRVALAAGRLSPASVIVDVLLDVRNLTAHPGTVEAVDAMLRTCRGRAQLTEHEVVKGLSAVWYVHAVAQEEQWWAP